MIRINRNDFSDIFSVYGALKPGGAGDRFICSLTRRELEELADRIPKALFSGEKRGDLSGEAQVAFIAEKLAKGTK